MTVNIQDWKTNKESSSKNICLDVRTQEEFIEGYIHYKMDNEVTPWRTRPNPMEFVMYYSV